MKPTGTKKLHSISEVKFSRSSTPFDKDPKARMKFAINANFIRVLSFRRSFFKYQISGHFLGFPTDPRRFSRLLQVMQSGILCVPEKRRQFWQYHECWPFDLFPSAIILTGRIKRWNKPRHSCMIFGYSSGSIFRP